MTTSDKHKHSKSKEEQQALTRSWICDNSGGGAAVCDDHLSSFDAERGEMLAAFASEKAQMREAFEREKNDMVEAFELTSSILLRRIADLEQAMTSFDEQNDKSYSDTGTASTRPDTGTRPGTAAIRLDNFGLINNPVSASAAQNHKRLFSFPSSSSAASSTSGAASVDEERGRFENADGQQHLDKVVVGEAKGAPEVLSLQSRTLETDREFIQAAREGDVSSLELLRAEFTIPVDEVACPDSGDSLLHACIQAEKSLQQQVLNFALGYGAEIDEKNFKGRTPLHDATTSDSLSMAKALIELGADLNAPIAPLDCNLGSASSKAVSASTASSSSAATTTTTSSQRTNDNRDEGYTALMLAAKDPKLLRICKLLVECGADVNVRSSAFGITAMEVAQKNNNYQAMVFLATNGASIKGRGQNLPPLIPGASRTVV